MKEHALYNDDEFITIGTTKEIADELGVGEKTIKNLLYPSVQKRTKRVLVEV